jgi:hypothetical protein
LLNPVGTPERFKTTRIPFPAGINVPDNENARTVDEFDEIINPLELASPPSALLMVAPSTLN